MITPETFSSILAVYAKHDWLLRRILVTEELRESLNSPISQLPGGVQIVGSDIDAAWFSRTPATGGVPWEIRHLSDNPYALLYTIDEREADFENMLGSVEDEFREHISTEKAA